MPPNSRREAFDHSGQVIAEVVADILNACHGREIDTHLVATIQDQIAASVGIVGLKEAAQILGTSSPNVANMRTVEGNEFPEPIALLGRGPLWLTGDIQAYSTIYHPTHYKPRGK